MGLKEAAIVVVEVPVEDEAAVEDADADQAEAVTCEEDDGSLAAALVRSRSSLSF